MKLSQIFDYLATGELSQLFLAPDGSRDTISDAQQRPIAQSIQLGLTALYKRFDLKNKEITIQLLPGRTTFPLRSTHLVSSDAVDTPKFIEDTPESPFLDDVLRVTRVFTIDGEDLPLNKSSSVYNVYTPIPETLVIPHALAFADTSLPDKYKVDKLKVAYRANHPNIMSRIGPLNADRVEVELPQTHLQALLYFVASRAMNPTGMINEFHSGNSWYQKYELECRQLEQEGTGNETDLSHIRFIKGGWA